MNAPRHRRIVYRDRLTLGGKVFECSLPVASGITVLAEWHPEHADLITVYTLSGLLICTACLVADIAGDRA